MKILNTIFYALFIVLLLGVASLFLASLLPIPGNVQIKIVKSGSMEPAIKTGSVVVLKPQESYKVGDVITFGEDTGTQIPTTHRIIEVRQEGSQTFYMTKGDANEDPDNVQIAKSEVEGRVLFNVPYAGYVLDFAKQPIGFTLMIGLPAAMIILDELMRIFQEVRRIRGGRRRRKKEKGSAPLLRQSFEGQAPHSPSPGSVLDLRNSYE
ncbi:signal peptidase I [Candidatus Kaiserbacteria bacterium]|nr:signal peptidase I [Candidatus Kaiserbacteria bacterium]